MHDNHDLFDKEAPVPPNLNQEAMQRVEDLRHTHHAEYRRDARRLSLLRRDIGVDEYGWAENVPQPRPPTYEDDVPLTDIFPGDD